MSCHENQLATESSVMAAERGQSSQKLVYLRDHTPRPRSRIARNSQRSTPPPADLASAATWLARSLLVGAGGLLLYWMGLASGTSHPGGSESWRWASSHALPHLFLAGSAAFTARTLLRSEERAHLFVALVAGALIVLALEGLTRAVIGGDLGDLSLSVRTDVLVHTGTLAIGVWAASFAVRSDSRPAAA